MIEDEDIKGLEMDVDIVSALIERAELKEEWWRFQGAIMVLLDLMFHEAEHALEEGDEAKFAAARDTVGTILTLMLYLDRVPSEEEIDAEAAKFRNFLAKALDPEGDKKEEDES